MRMWKVLGVAGLVGAAAAGVAVGSRSIERQRREYLEADPDELRARLHQRFEAADGARAAPS